MRLIDADALIRRWCGMKCGCEREECGREIEPCIVVAAIEDAPTIEPEWKMGKWTVEDCHAATYKYCCSNCRAHHRAMYDYCPSCGADMRGEQG